MLTRIRNYDLSDIKSSINYLLDKAADSEEVRTLAIEIVSNKEDQIAAVYDWVKSNVTYVKDPVRGYGEVELFTSPIRMVKDYRNGIRLGGDCDCMALLTTALYRSIGYQSNVVLLDTTGEGLNHAISQVLSDGIETWVMVDPSASVPLGWTESYTDKVIVGD